MLDSLREDIENGQHALALKRLQEGLTALRAAASPTDWRTFCVQTLCSDGFRHHAVSRLLQSGPITGRCAQVGRGEVNHPGILDLIFGVDAVPQGSARMSNAVREWESNLGFCQSLRARQNVLARELQEVGNSVRYPRILAVASGHLREAANSFALASMRGAEFVAFDSNHAAIEFIEREYDYAGLTTMSGSVRDLIAQRGQLGKFDFIYLATLADRFENYLLAPLVTSLAAALERGGRLMVANVTPELLDAAYLEAGLDWWPVYRTEEDMAALAAGIPEPVLRGRAVFREETGGSLFLDLQAI